MIIYTHLRTFLDTLIQKPNSPPDKPNKPSTASLERDSRPLAGRIRSNSHAPETHPKMKQNTGKHARFMLEKRQRVREWHVARMHGGQC